MMPRSEEMPGAADAGHLPDTTRTLLRESSWLMWLGLVGGAVGFLMSPVTTVYWPLPSLLLPRAVLIRHAERYASHRQYHLRQSATLLKLVAAFALARDPAARVRLGLDPWQPDPGGWRTS